MSIQQKPTGKITLPMKHLTMKMRTLRTEQEISRVLFAAVFWMDMIMFAKVRKMQ